MAGSGHKPRILAVDDDPIILRLLSRFLSQEGYEIVECTGAGDGRKHLDSGGFSLLITDLHMPDGTGLDLAEHLRKRDANLPVLILSGSIGEDTVRAAAQLGRVTCMSKPLDQDQLLRTVRDLLRIGPA